jgi:hypothetical protein
VTTTTISAAAPDGSGPWADEVTSSHQADTKGGQPVSTVNPSRSDPSSTLGPAENTDLDGTFFSLGFGGSITLKFDNKLSAGAIIVESTRDPNNYPNETAQVEISADGSTWYTAGQVDRDGQVGMPNEITCAQYVRITDTSNPADYPDDEADGYDVDGVQTVNAQDCSIPSTSPDDPANNPSPTATLTPTPTSPPTNNSNDNHHSTDNSSSPAPICNSGTPTTPTIQSAVRNTVTTVQLTWTAVSPVNHYTIAYGTSPGQHSYGVPNTGNTTSFTIGGLDPNSAYYFVIRAVNDCAPSEASNEVSSGVVNGGQILGAAIGPQGNVLGTSTTELAATGSTWQRIAAVTISVLLGLITVFVGLKKMFETSN